MRVGWHSSFRNTVVEGTHPKSRREKTASGNSTFQKALMVIPLNNLEHQRSPSLRT